MVTKPNQSKPVMYDGLPKGPYPFFSRLKGELEDNIRSHESGFSYLGELGSEILFNIGYTCKVKFFIITR